VAFALFLTLSNLLTGCGGGTSTKASPVPSQRNGRSIVSVTRQFIDLAPSISADGTRITFVSGRTGADRIFRSEYTSGQSPTAPSRITSDDSITKELASTLSGNGAWVLIPGVKDGIRDLFFMPFGGGGLQQLTTDKDSESEARFSPDSSLFAFIKSASPGAPGRAYIGSVGDGSTVTVAAIGNESDRFSQVIWGPGSYTLYAVGTDGTSTKRQLVSFTFSDYSSASTAVASTLLTDLPSPVLGQNNAGPVLAGSSMLFSQRLSTGARSVSESGKAPQTGPTYGVKTETIAKALDGSTSSIWSTLATTDSTPMAASSDGATVFSLNREVIRCVAEEAPSYVGYLMITAADGSNAQRLIPRTGPTAGTYEMTDDACNRTHADGTSSTLDFSVAGAVFSAQSTREAFRAAIVTSGNSAGGDPEVILIDRMADGTTYYYSLSQNPKT